MNPFYNELISVEFTSFHSVSLTWEEFEELYYAGFWTEEGLEAMSDEEEERK